MISRLAALGALILVPALAAAAQPSGAPSAQPPVVYAQKTRSYDVELRIDPELKRYGGLYVDYRDRTLRGFNALEREADQLAAFQPRSGSPHPLVDRVEVILTCETPHLIGVIQRSYQDRHGAHPSYDIHGYILDRTSGQRLGASDLLKPGTDMAPLDAALQAAIDEAKHARHGDQLVPLPPASSLPTWDSGRSAIKPRNNPPADATLAPGGSGAIAGGLQFLYAPYDFGPYSEGAYRAVLPYKVFAAAVNPQYSADFTDPPTPSPEDPLQGFPSDAGR